MTSTRTMGRDGATLRVRGWDGSSLGAGTLGGAEPLGFAAGDANLYRYVGNDPVDSTDPSGLIDVKNPRPVTTTEFPVRNPNTTFVLAGPPIELDPNDPDNHRPITAPKQYFCKTRGIPEENYYSFWNLDDFAKQIAAINSRVWQGDINDVTIIISVHGRPGSLFFGRDKNGDLIRVDADHPENLKRLIDNLDYIFNRNYYGDNTNANPKRRSGSVFLEGCNTMGFNTSSPNQKDVDLSNELFSQLYNKLLVNLYGEVGFSAVFGSNMMIEGNGGMKPYTPKPR